MTLYGYDPWRKSKFREYMESEINNFMYLFSKRYKRDIEMERFKLMAVLHPERIDTLSEQLAAKYKMKKEDVMRALTPRGILSDTGLLKRK